MIMGGNADTAGNIIKGDINELKNLLTEDIRYGKQNPGVPISYTTNFLQDNEQARISNLSQYVETTVTSYENSLLTLEHSGAYVAQFHVEWNAVSHDEEGNEVLTPKVWDKSGQNLTAHWKETIPLSGNVRNLRIVCKRGDWTCVGAVENRL